jgi:hypothetical protein
MKKATAPGSLTVGTRQSVVRIKYMSPDLSMSAECTTSTDKEVLPQPKSLSGMRRTVVSLPPVSAERRRGVSPPRASSKRIPAFLKQHPTACMPLSDTRNNCY